MREESLLSRMKSIFKCRYRHEILDSYVISIDTSFAIFICAVSICKVSFPALYNSIQKDGLHGKQRRVAQTASTA